MIGLLSPRFWFYAALGALGGVAMAVAVVVDAIQEAAPCRR